MTIMTRNDKPGRLTDSKWLFCEIGQHNNCVTEIELSSHFEACPCECHQIAQQPTQPAPDGGEWRVHTNKREIVNEHGFYVAFTTDEQIAARIVADHRAVPKLVEALRRAIEEIETLTDALEDFHGPSSRPNLTFTILKETLTTTTQPDAGEGQR